MRCGAAERSTCSTSRRRWRSPSGTSPASSFRPKGDLIYFGVADEEAGGKWGAEWMFEHHPDAIDADYCVTELGGWSTVDDHGHRHVTVNVGEKGLAWRTLRVHGTPGHGSMPFGSDNALVKAAEIVRPARRVPADAVHQRHLARPGGDIVGCPPSSKAALVDPERIDAALATLPVPVARSCHAVTHTTISPNVAHGGQKTNIIPDVGRHRGRHPHRARHHPRRRRRRCSPTRSGELAPHVEVTELQHSRRHVVRHRQRAVAHDRQAHPGRLSRAPGSCRG